MLLKAIQNLLDENKKLENDNKKIENEKQTIRSSNRRPRTEQEKARSAELRRIWWEKKRAQDAISKPKPKKTQQSDG